MKYSMESNYVSLSTIGQDFDRVKRIFTQFKKASMNKYISDGYALMQEA